jgi:DNA-directed RNA polymerase specialized sigma subunit
MDGENKMFYRKDSRQHQDEINRKPSEEEVQYGSEPTCFEVHEKWQVECDQTKCRNWMDFEGDLNCAVVCARKYPAGLSLREVAERMNVSFPRISQIEHGAFKKMKEMGLIKELEDE